MWITDSQFDTYLEDLKSWLRFASVSADSAYKPALNECAVFTRDYLEKVGFRASIHETPGHPVVYGERIVNPSLPTVLVYGHYDVQPPDPLDLWVSPPFDPQIRDGQLIARGVSDDKGQVFCHIAAVDWVIRRDGDLPVNVKLIIEGEEEIGSPNLVRFLTDNRDMLAADVALVSDTPMIAKDRPSLCTSLRGLVYFELKIRTLGSDLHSGQHGGTVPNAIAALVELLSRMKDANGRIQIPGFYDAVLPISDTMHKGILELPFNESEYLRSIGAAELVGESGFHPYERRWLRPTLDVNGIWGGYTGEGSKTVIPSVAHAKLSMRLVANQDPDDITDKFCSFVRTHTPYGATVEIEKFSGAFPARVDGAHPAVQAAMYGLYQAFGVEPVFQGEGGTIPVVADFKRILGIDTVLMGLNLPDDGIHAPNERMSLANIRRGINASIGFLTKLNQTV
ncbi:dipeptidase [bacterium]|nr:dipeptidase [bacterium]